MARTTQGARTGHRASGGSSGCRDTSGVGQWNAISSAAASLGVQLSPVDVRDAAEIERKITTFARLGNGGLIIQGSPLSLVHRELTIALAARQQAARGLLP